MHFVVLYRCYDSPNVVLGLHMTGGRFLGNHALAGVRTNIPALPDQRLRGHYHCSVPVRVSEER